jgi:hypothetical protein
MSLLTFNDAGFFDSGPVAITASSSWQQVGLLRVQERGATIKLKTLVATIGHVKLTQGAYIDDPDHVDVAVDDVGLNAPALSDERYCTPALVIPLGIGSVYQIRVEGRAAEIAIWANTGGTGATLEMSGVVDRITP